MQIERFRGDTSPITCTVSSSTTSLPVNITGCSFKLTVSRVANPADTSQQVYQIDGNIADAENGVVEFPASLSQADQVGYFYYDIQMTDTYNKVQTLVKSNLVYKQDITK